MVRRGSQVRRRHAELEFLSLCEVARDFLASVLNPDVTMRDVLKEVFGGDCCRISCLRTLLEAAKVSEACAKDQRLSMCIRACESVERVLEDLGLGEALRQALHVEKEARARQAALLAEESVRIGP